MRKQERREKEEQPIEKLTEIKKAKRLELSKPSWSPKHPFQWAFGVFLLLAMVFFFEVIFRGQTYQAPDAQSAAAMTARLDNEFKNTGKLPQWTPYIFCGMPSFASLMYTPYVYFPGLVLLPLTFLGSLPAMLSPTLHYILAAMGVFVFLQRKGTGFWPALLGGIAFMFTPFLITMQVFGHGSQMMTSAYIPWALWAVDRLMEKFSWRNLGLAGLILGFQFQRGHIQISYYILLIIGLYVLCQLIFVISQKDFKRVVSMLGGFVGALALASALAAILYLPLQEYTPYSIRGTPSVLQVQTGPKDTGVGFDYATQWSFSLGEMATFIIPSFYGFGGITYWGNMPFTDYPNYMGILVLILAVVAFYFYLRKDFGFIIFSGIVILLSLSISFGDNFPSLVYKFFYYFVPYFNKFRVPVMILILMQCMVAILAGLGLEGLILRLSQSAQTNTQVKDGAKVKSKGKKKEHDKNTFNTLLSSPWLWIAVVLAIAILVTFFHDALSLFSHMHSVYQNKYKDLIPPQQIQQQLNTLDDMLLKDIWTVSVLVSVALVFAALAAAKQVSVYTMAVVICLLSVADLWLVDKKLGETHPQEQLSAFLEPDIITQFLQEKEKKEQQVRQAKPEVADTSVFRIYPTGRLFGDVNWAGQSLQSVGGYHPAKPRFYQDFIEFTGLQSNFGDQLPAHHVLNMINAKYLLTLTKLPEPEWMRIAQAPISIRDTLTIYENPTVLPRAYLAGEFEVQTEPVAALMRLRAGPGQGFDPHRRVMLAETPDITPQPDSSASAQIRQYDYHQITIATKSAAPQILVLSDNYYPAPAGWQAYIDNQPVKTYRANYCFRAVAVPAGNHQVEFRFHSRAFTLGLWTSLIALAVGITLLFVDRRQPPVSP